MPRRRWMHRVHPLARIVQPIVQTYNESHTVKNSKITLRPPCVYYVGIVRLRLRPHPLLLQP